MLVQLESFTANQPKTVADYFVELSRRVGKLQSHRLLFAVGRQNHYRKLKERMLKYGAVLLDDGSVGCDKHRTSDCLGNCHRSISILGSWQRTYLEHERAHMTLFEQSQGCIRRMRSTLFVPYAAVTVPSRFQLWERAHANLRGSGIAQSST